MTGAEIAIIGMSGRFPEAATIDQFWKNLTAGKESISFLSEEELRAPGGPEWYQDPRFVPSRGGVLDNIDYFDHAFFNYTPREAEIMDPQFRVFHECVWNALEDAGYAREGYKGLIGLYAGASGNFQWQKQLADSGRYSNRQGLTSIQFVERDFLPTLISYNLDLRGPSYNVQTACSTSLVAVHLACQALLNGECNLALAGGVCIASGMDKGYVYQEGSIFSPDGHCRAFDARAKGSIHGSGAGVVVLKLLEDALADGDQVYAVIKGSAINNDGKRKVGFTAPSIAGQVHVIREALQMAEVDPHEISYIEAHGTGTELGDPIEMEALRTVFGECNEPYCGIGSVKTNIGHLDAAAGVTGLIKTVLALKHRKMPPTLHFTAPNPKLAIAGSAFYIVDELRDWTSDTVRRAGVSSFGIGGTNAHIILEEAPAAPASPSLRDHHLIAFSARTSESCHQWVQAFSHFLQDHPGVDMGDAAWSLCMGRKDFPWKGFLVCSNSRDAIAKIASMEIKYNETVRTGNALPAVVFLFPGQGAQYMRMGFDLYTMEPVFRDEWNRCTHLYQSITGQDLHGMIYPADLRDNTALINQTAVTQPLLFIFEYCLAKLLFSLGIKPDYMFGHSIGEYTAACLAGVFSLEDAIRLVIERGRLINALPGGLMLSVPLTESEVSDLLKQHGGTLSLAAVNSTGQCVVSGPAEAVTHLHEYLQAGGIQAVVLRTSHAFHSGMMEPALAAFTSCFDHIVFNQPNIPFLSCLTGKPVTAEEVVSPHYWAAQLRHTVRFSAGIENLMEKENILFLEVGPGNTLSNFIMRHRARKEGHQPVNLVRPFPLNDADDRYLYEKLGRLWLAGLSLNLGELYTGEKRNKISLPSYCYNRKKIESIPAAVVEKVVEAPAAAGRRTAENWFYTRVWQQQPPGLHALAPSRTNGHASLTHTAPVHWVLFAGRDPLSAGLVTGLAGHRISIVQTGDSFAQPAPDHFIINATREEDYGLLAASLSVHSGHNLHIIHAWSLQERPQEALNTDSCYQQMDRGFFSVLNLVRSVGGKAAGMPGGIQLTILTNNTFRITGNDLHCPENGVTLALPKILPLEYRKLTCRLIDLSLEHFTGDVQATVYRLQAMLSSADRSERISALRGSVAWTPLVKPVQPGAYPDPVHWMGDEKNYLVLGSGGMGIYTAKYIAEQFHANVFIVHRSAFPAEAEWDNIVKEEPQSQTAIKINILQQLKQNGRGQVHLVQSDITNLESMSVIVNAIEQTYGKIHGVVHAAGIIDKGGVVQRRTNQSVKEALAAKVSGAIIIETLFRNRPLEGFVVFSSLGNELFDEKYGEIGYGAANEFLEAYVQYSSSIDRKIVINWCDWQEVGMAEKAIDALFGNAGTGQEERVRFREMAIRPEEGMKVFDAVCRSALPVHLIYPFDLLQRLQQREKTLLDYPRYLEQKLNLLAGSAGKTFIPSLKGENNMDQVLNVWKEYLGHTEISIHDNLFELGVSSLDVVQVNNILKSSLHIDVPLTALFEHPTIHSFVTYLEGAGKKEDTVNRLAKIDSGKNKLEKLKKLSGSK